MRCETFSTQKTIWKSLLISLLVFVNVSRGEKGGISLHQNLSGIYNYVSVKDILRIQPEDPFFLALVCPPTLIVNVSNSQPVANITLAAGAEADSRCFFAANGSTSTAEVAFQLLSLDTSRVNNSDGNKISLLDLTNYFPLAGGNVGNVELMCPLLNRTVSNAQIVAQDMGFFFSLINHYRKSGVELGTAFSEIESSSLAPIEHSFSLNVALDSKDGIGCSYLKEGDEARLRAKALKVLEADATASPEADESPSQTPNATDESGENACFPAAARVKVKSGMMVPMSELQVGDEVMDGDGSYSKVLMFTHSDSKVRRPAERARREQPRWRSRRARAAEGGGVRARAVQPADGERHAGGVLGRRWRALQRVHVKRVPAAGAHIAGATSLARHSATKINQAALAAAPRVRVAASDSGAR
ncbi:hypothetical protein FGB62_313g012 [Gracilaria domingensis]|nr:hypothetical protein FGB62_313g012 [Gracilaria domingensis]